MQYTVKINEKKRTITVTLADGNKGVARCNPSDRFDINTGIELALERAKVAKANANKPKSTAKPTFDEAIAILEEYVGDHIVIIGKGKTPSENQKRELRRWADVLAPSHSCKCEDKYDEGYADGYTDGYADGCDEYEPNCGCHGNGGCECDEISLARRMIARIDELLGK